MQEFQVTQVSGAAGVTVCLPGQGYWEESGGRYELSRYVIRETSIMPIVPSMKSKGHNHARGNSEHQKPSGLRQRYAEDRNGPDGEHQSHATCDRYFCDLYLRAALIGT